MAENSKIAWTDHTWNPWQGCHKVSPACDNCYMYRDKKRYGQDPGTVIRSSKNTFNLPLKSKDMKPGDKIFVCSWSDFFIKEADLWRQEAWDIIRRTPQYIYLILTKRPENILSRLPEDWGSGWPNVWLGVTAENQEMADLRIPILLQIPAAVRFVSVEPMLGPVDLTKINYQGSLKNVQPGVDLPFRVLINSLIGEFDDGWDRGKESKLDWVVLGGETGSGARPIEPRWARNVKDQCVEAGVPFFFKSWGWNKADYIGRPKNRLLDDREWNELPPVKACLEE